MSQLNWPGPRRMPKPELPNTDPQLTPAVHPGPNVAEVAAGGATKAAGLIQVDPTRLVVLPVVAIFVAVAENCAFPVIGVPKMDPPLVSVIVNGVPSWMVVTPETVHPAAIQCTKPIEWPRGKS